MAKIGSDIVIRNGTVIDGTGATGFKCDVEINNGIIVAMGVNLPTGATEIDATRAKRKVVLIEWRTLRHSNKIR